MSALILTSVKDEGPWLIEWVAYHGALGANDILIYQNESTDLTHEILQRLQELGVVHYKDNTNTITQPPKPRKRRPQLEAYSDAFGSDLYARNKWCLVIDVDEYLNLKIHDSMDEFCTYHSAVDAVAINWRCFGSAGRTLWSPMMTIDRFDRCAPEQHYSSLKFKSMHRTDRGFRAIGIHRPRGEAARDAYVYAGGPRVSDVLQLDIKQGKWQGTRGYHAVAQINHYTVRSREEARRKMVRGRGTGKPAHDFDYYFNRFDLNHMEETSISRHAFKARRRYNELLDDAVLRELYRESCRIHFVSPASPETADQTRDAA